MIWVLEIKTINEHSMDCSSRCMNFCLQHQYPVNRYVDQSLTSNEKLHITKSFKIRMIFKYLDSMESSNRFERLVKSFS